MTDHELYREWSAAYVLGALDGEDRRLFEGHLDNCEGCQRDIRSFAPIPGLLARIESPDILRVPDRVLDRALVRVRSDWSSLARSRRRWRWAAAVAALAAVVALAGSLLVSRTGMDTAVLAIEPGATASGEISVASRPWGTAITLELENLPPSDRYEAWAVDREGAWQQVAVWGPTFSFKAVVSGASSFATEDLSTIVVTTGNRAETVATARHLGN